MSVSKESETMSMERIDRGTRIAAFARRAATAAIAAVALTAVLVPSASAAPDFAEYVVGSSSSQAGGHPDLNVSMRLENAAEPEVVRDLTFNLPEGVFGNPGAIYKCEAADFAVNHCQPGSQAGFVSIVSNYQGTPNTVLGTAPVYNMRTIDEEETARLSFVVPVVNVPIGVPVSVRSGSDYGLKMTAASISQTVALSAAEFLIWGFPADSEHDAERFHPGEPGEPPGCVGETSTDCISAPYPEAGKLAAPFIDNPSICTGAELPVTVDAVSYQDPDHTSHLVSSYPETTGCENQRFDPVFNLGLTTGESDAPSGMDIELRARQFLEGEAPTPSNLRSARLTLPPGLTVNPDAADGQTSCSDAQAGFHQDAPGHCPDNAKIGTVEVRTPALDAPLDGSLYIGEPQPGNQYRLFMLFDGFGIHAKLAADVHPDPATGQLVVTMTDLPQVPFETFELHLFASDRGLLATPTHCTLYHAESNMVPWNSALATQHSSPFVTITVGPHESPCPGQVRPFEPRLIAGTSNPLAGNYSSFTLKLDRDDGDQYLGDLNFKLPPGFTGSLRGLTYCPDASIQGAETKTGRAEVASPSCPESSFVGTTNVAAGPGEHPFHAVGRMYLSGPLNGAPLSVVAITPALAGPYDYGVVVVRVALNIDPKTAQVIAVSNTVPSIIGGIPIRMRSISVNIDKPNFTINPTNCSPFTVDSQGIGDQGTVSDFSSYFQAVNCRTLPFKPRMKVTQLGRKATTRSKNPRVVFDLFTRPGDANLKEISVTLPKAFAIDQRHLGNICSKAQLAAEHCAGRQAIGRAMTKTPLLDKPLSGPAYAVSGFGKLPHVVFILAGQVTIMPEAESSSVKGGHLKTVVPVVPDAPIGHFRLKLFGGKKGYLVNTRSLCASPSKTLVEYVAQSGRKLKQRVKTKTACGKGRKSKRAHRRAHR
jgi:hypothetical protein